MHIHTHICTFWSFPTDMGVLHKAHRSFLKLPWRGGFAKQYELCETPTKNGHCKDPLEKGLCTLMHILVLLPRDSQRPYREGYAKPYKQGVLQSPP